MAEYCVKSRAQSIQTNVLVDDDGVAKICDFGWVRLVDWQGIEEITADPPTSGIEWYTALELLITPKPPTFESDIYALGCTVLEVGNGYLSAIEGQ